MSFKIIYLVDTMDDDYHFFSDRIESQSFEDALAQVRKDMALFKTKEATIYQEVAYLDSYDAIVECAKELNVPKQFSGKQLDPHYKKAIKNIQKLANLAIGQLAQSDNKCPNGVECKTLEDLEHNCFKCWYDFFTNIVLETQND